MTNSSSSSSNVQHDQLLINSLKKHNVIGKVIDIDFRRHAMSISTDYIISIEPKEEKEELSFNSYYVSKKYTDFRDLSKKIDNLVEEKTKDLDKWDELSTTMKRIISLNGTIQNYVKSQDKEYLGKINFNHVKQLSKIRSEIINGILEEILKRGFPPNTTTAATTDVTTPEGKELEHIITTFLLTDFCEEDASDDITSSSLRQSTAVGRASSIVKGTVGSTLGKVTLGKTPDTPKYRKKPEATTATGATSGGGCTVTPITKKRRASVQLLQKDMEFLNEDASCRKLTMMSEEAGNDGNSSSIKSKKSVTLSVPSSTTGSASGGGRKPTPASKMKKKSASASAPSSGSIIDLINSNPLAFFGVLLVVAYVISNFVSGRSITIDADTFIIILFGSYFLGFHTSGAGSGGGIGGAAESSSAAASAPVTAAATAAAKPRPSLASRALSMKRIASATNEEVPEMEDEEEYVEEEEEDTTIKGPFPYYPKGAELGEYNNCWSQPPCETFHIRGPNYFTDRKKVASAEFVFPARGVDLFITDLCPENVGLRNPTIFGGQLRTVPTFLLNFRLPWGVLVSYTQIPNHLLPYLYKCYDPERLERDNITLPNIDGLSKSSDKCVARWLMGDDEYKNNRLKIVPVVVKGPWIVKSVVGGKPAIMGTKMPVKYFYSPPDATKGHEAYLEVDFDIVSSAAARSILSVTSNAATSLTIDLGFVIEARENDELPECMLNGQRLHGIDPLTAPPLPPTANDILDFNDIEENDSLLDHDDD